MSSNWHALHAQLVRSVERLSSHKHFVTIRKGRAVFAGIADIAALMDHQHDPDGDPDRKDHVLRALIIEARAAGTAAETAQVLVMLALWPGLDAIHGRLRRHFASDPERLAGELVGRLSLAISTADLERINRLAATLLRNVERDLRRMLQAEWRRREEALQDDLQVQEPAPGSDRVGNMGLADVGDLLTRLRGVVGSDAALVVAVSVLGYSQREAAVAFGLSHDAARKRYQRALKRLQTAFVDHE